MVKDLRRELLAYALLAVVLGGSKCLYDRGQREQGALRERVRVAESAGRQLTKTVRVVDTLWRRDTVRLAANVALWKATIGTLAGDVERYRDSIAKLEGVPPDTVPVPVEVIRWVTASADSVIESCRLVQVSCETRVAVRDSLIRTLRQQVEISKKQRPGFVKRWGERALWIAALAVVSQR